MKDGIRFEVGSDKTIGATHSKLIGYVVIANNISITGSDAFQRISIKRTS